MDFNKILIILLFMLFYLPIFSGLVDSWQVNPYYSHGPLIPIVSLYLLWRRKNQLKYSDSEFNYGIMALVLGLTVYGTGILYKSLFISAVSFIIVLSGLILSFYGKKVLGQLLFPISFLIFMMPLPYMDYVSFQMQSITAQSSAAILHLLGIPVTTTASQIRLENTLFVIGEPCSGLRTLISLLAVSTVFAYAVEGQLNRKIILTLSALPIAAAANILRVSSILLIANYQGKEAAMQYYHDLSSILMFLIAVILLILVGRGLKCSKLRNI